MVETKLWPSQGRLRLAVATSRGDLELFAGVEDAQGESIERAFAGLYLGFGGGGFGTPVVS